MACPKIISAIKDANGNIVISAKNKDGKVETYSYSPDLFSLKCIDDEWSIVPGLSPLPVPGTIK
jgi:hypothetical protein